jgi:hypothetical protein
MTVAPPLQPITHDQLVSNLVTFRDWVRATCKGRERGEAQVFLDRFFQCFGLKGVLDAGGTFELPQKKSSKAGNTGFLDCLYPGVALFEMKQRGASLAEHYNQLLTYWTYCVPKPMVGVLCNFDAFWIYDFNVQVDTPVQVLPLDDLARHPEALRFMLGQAPTFGRNLVDITEEAAAEISTLYQSILSRRDRYGATEEDIQRFVLQCVLCLFAEDIGLLPRDLFTNLLQDCIERPHDSYNLLHGLFTQMNTPRPAPGGRFQGVRYFNGGLFNTITPVELETEELLSLYRIGSKFDWSMVRPSIFGTIFERAIGHQQGSHFTSEVDIYKIVNPTIVRYWEERIEVAGDDVKKLRQCLTGLRQYKVLDPACGSGNFLYVAFQEMKRLEKRLMDHIKYIVETSPRNYTAKDAEGTDLSLVSPLQFYGIEIKPFAVELARLTLEIGRKVAVNKFHLTEDVLPLDNLSDNILCADALFTPWPVVDAIIGNPPFIGSRHLRKNGLTDAYIQRLHKLYPASEFPKSADYCAYWFRMAHEQPATRIGLVGTNSISQGQGRKASLSYIAEHGGVIYDAISTQPWSGEAKVHVSIVNWAKTDPGSKFLDNAQVSSISPSLKSTFDVTSAHRLKQNEGLCFQGVILVGENFLVSESQAKEWIIKNSNNQTVLKIFSMGANLADSPNLLSDRWVIDFNQMSIEEASLYKEPFEHVKEYVKPQRDTVIRDSTREKWWQYGEKRPAMRQAIEKLPYCFAVPAFSKWYIFTIFQHSRMLPGNKNYIVAFDDKAILGFLCSKLHRDWVYAQMATIKADPSYTNTTCFETFPFLWHADEALKAPVREIMTALDDYRMAEMHTRQWGITRLYNTFFHEPASKLHKLHRQLDEAVCAVYGWPYDPAKNYNEALFHLNQRLYEQEQSPLLASIKPKNPRRPAR